MRHPCLSLLLLFSLQLPGSFSLKRTNRFLGLVLDQQCHCHGHRHHHGPHHRHGLHRRLHHCLCFVIAIFTPTPYVVIPISPQHLLASSSPSSKRASTSRIFQVVTFPNDACTANSLGEDVGDQVTVAPQVS